MRKQRGDLTIPWACQVFFAFSLKIFYAAGMPPASVGDRECLNFSWIPIYEVLEQRGLKAWLVDARQVKFVPGRKSDVQDCQWLQKLT